MLQGKKPFLCGTCEGFYGKPWTFSQRQELFKRMKRFGMNTYLYAPKDDYKHRLYWRELYSSDEADELRFLVRCAEEEGISFVYAISPGLDIVYCSPAEVAALKQKLLQVKELGCRSFALLFDDIEDDLSVEDSRKFASIAEAQACLSNDVFAHLGHPDLFLFCPTEYCSSRSLPTVKDSPYLKSLGLRLDHRIDFFWTGPKVVSRRITMENIEEVSAVMKRPVTIWDNIHANDYDQSRIYLGPFDGRPCQLLAGLRGVLTNPNCEFEANFIALHTLAQWSRNTVTRFPVSASAGEADMEVEEEAAEAEYEPRKALEMALLDWLPELYKAKSSFGQKNALCPEGASKKKEEEEEEDKTFEKCIDVELEDKAEAARKMEDDVAMATDEEGRSRKKCGEDRKKKQELYWQELQMICDFFYLPFEHGPTGEKMLNAARWLVEHFHLVFHPDSLQQRFTSAGFYQCTTMTQQATLPLSATTAASGSTSSTGSPIADPLPLPIADPLPLPIADETTKEAFNSVPINDTTASSTDTTSATATTVTSATTTSTTHRQTAAKSMYGYDDDDLCYSGPQTAADWYERAIRFHDGYGDLSTIVDKLVNIPNRELLYELYKYINDIRSNLALVNSYIKWHGIDKRDKELFKSGEQEPWVHRGGLLAEFRRLLPFETSRANNNVYIVRPYYSKDYLNVSSVCLKTFNDLSDASRWMANPPTLLADCFIGAYLTASSKFCFLLEDNVGVAGYVVAFARLQELLQVLQGEWLGELKRKYPLTADRRQERSASLPLEEEKLFEAPAAATQMSTEALATEDEPMSAASSSRSVSPEPAKLFCPPKMACTSPQHLLQLLHSDDLFSATFLLAGDQHADFIRKFPSPVSVSLSRYKERAAQMLLASVEQALCNGHSTGMHALVRSNHKSTLQLYFNLGFLEQSASDVCSKGFSLLYKAFPVDTTTSTSPLPALDTTTTTSPLPAVDTTTTSSLPPLPALDTTTTTSPSPAVKVPGTCSDEVPNAILPCQQAISPTSQSDSKAA